MGCPRLEWPPIGGALLASPIPIHVKGDGVREGWGAILEMDDYPAGWNDLSCDYADAGRWNETLHALGWQDHHITMIRGELNRSAVEEAVNFLAGNCDEDDVVLLFIFAHGNWISRNVEWNSWFPARWMTVPSGNKVVVVSSCSAASFINPLRLDPAPHISVAAVDVGETAWAGLPEEGLPIIGEVMSYYLTEALLNSSADVDKDEDVTVEEAFAHASPRCRNYLANVVFPAYPYYAEMCNWTAPHPVLDDSYPGRLSLRVEPGPPPTYTGNPSDSGLLTLGVLTILFVGIATTATVVGAAVILKRRSRHPTTLQYD